MSLGGLSTAPVAKDGLALCRKSEIPCAERFYITLAQAVERQPSQGEFFNERSEDRFPLRLIRFQRRTFQRT